MKGFFWVQHLFGLGHARRMARIAAACGTEGVEVTVAAGGPGGRALFQGLPHVAAHQLPPLKTSDHQYTGLLTDAGAAPDEAFWVRRHEALTYLLTETKPDILLIELFPFGRRKFADEVLGLIEAAKAFKRPPLIVSSVRDVVEPKTADKTAQMASWLKAHFDAVLVHGDETVIELSKTAPFAGEGDVPLYYTGYVAPEIEPTGEKAGVVVSAGSGASGAALLAAAAQAGASAAHEKSPWHIFVPQDIARPNANKAKNAHVHIHPFTEEFSTYLARAEVSLGEAGYNTTAEALVYSTKAVLVPYDGAGQTEQPTRARALAEAGLAVHLPARELNAANVLSAIDAAKALAPAKPLNLSGAKTTAAILKDLPRTLRAS